MADGDPYIGMVDVLGKRHRVIRASEDPDCPDKDKGKLFAACDPWTRVWIDPTATAVTCGNCKRMRNFGRTDGD